MPSIPCPQKVAPSGRCVCDDLPLFNLSAADEDRRIFIGYYSTPPTYWPQPGDLNQPGVPAICVSVVSQVVADECAANGTVPTPSTPEEPNPENPLEPPQPPDTPPQNTGDPNMPDPNQPGVPHEPEGFSNTESNCIALCADHSNSATAIIPAGTFHGQTQLEADMLASNACIGLARSRLLCFTPPSEGSVVHICADIYQSITCVVSGPVASISMTNLPVGMSFSCADSGICTIAGTPEAGNYLVSVNALSQTGQAVSFNFVIDVLGIACTAVPAYRGNAYIAAVAGVGGTAPYTFTPSSAGGLSIDASGAITGIPTDCPTINLPVTVTDHEGNTCSKTCVISVSLCDCPDWTQATGSLTNFVDVRTPGTADYGIFFTYAANNLQVFDCLPPHGDNTPSKSAVEITGSLAIPHGVCTCHVHIDVVGDWGDTGPSLSNVLASAMVKHGATTIVNASYTSDQSLDFDFAVGTNEVIQWVISSNAGYGSNDPAFPCASSAAAGNVRVTLLFTNLSSP